MSDIDDADCFEMIPPTTLVEIDHTGHAYPEKVYRYADGSTVETVYLETWGIKRRTPYGFWIDDYSEKGKFVLSDPRGKRWAYEDKDKALNSYIIRKQWQKRRAENTMSKADRFLRFAIGLRNDEGSGTSKG